MLVPVGRSILERRVEIVEKYLEGSSADSEVQISPTPDSNPKIQNRAINSRPADPELRRPDQTKGPADKAHPDLGSYAAPGVDPALQDHFRERGLVIARSHILGRPDEIGAPSPLGPFGGERQAANETVAPTASCFLFVPVLSNIPDILVILGIVFKIFVIFSFDP